MDDTLYLAADRRFFEAFDARPAREADFVGLVRGRLADGWRLERKGIWVHCLPEPPRLPLQGWKIHLSSVPGDARALLDAASAHLLTRGVPFKFLADADTLRMTGAKGWSRGASGKFVTVYPRDEAHFKGLLEELDALTRPFSGPYILSDRRYRDSRVVYYRYGGIRLRSRLRPDGRRDPVLVAPDGSETPDARTPVYRVPTWAADPFPAEAAAGADALLDGRYAVERPLHFSNTGGVYLARDAASGARVVLKEARPGVHGFTDDEDAVALLRREHAMLRMAEGAGASPRALGLFQAWEHHYLAQEYLDGYLTLLRFSSRSALFLETRPDSAKVSAHLRRELTVVRNLARAVEALHAAGLVLGDVSFNNVLVHPETLDVKVIDLEGAHRIGDPARPRIITPGFADAGASRRAPAPADDYYGVGAVLLFLLTHRNALLALEPEAGRRTLAAMGRDFGLPPLVGAAVEALLGADPAARPRPSALIERALESSGEIATISLGTERPGALSRDAALGREAADACRFIKAAAAPGRVDRLFPADAAVFETNAVSLAHGAAGVLYALHKAEGAVDPELTDWLAERATAGRACPPGLYTGTAGAAWALAELGRPDRAEELLAASEGDALLAASHDLYQGAAGWGLANLRLWRLTGARRWLENAAGAGAGILAAARRTPEGLSWPSADGTTQYGLGHGASGVALFLLTLDRALGGGRFAPAAADAMAFDLAHGFRGPDGSLSWRRDSASRPVHFPYWRAGGAGVGIACLRFWAATREARYREAVDAIALDCDRKYAVFAGRDDGLAGLGEFLLDAHLATGDPRFLAGAERAAAGLRLLAVTQPEGLAYPGRGLARLSCDLATGSAGVVLFQDRLRRPRPADFLLDEVLS